MIKSINLPFLTLYFNLFIKALKLFSLLPHAVIQTIAPVPLNSTVYLFSRLFPLFRLSDTLPFFPIATLLSPDPTSVFSPSFHPTGAYRFPPFSQRGSFFLRLCEKSCPKAPRPAHANVTLYVFARNAPDLPTILRRRSDFRPALRAAPLLPARRAGNKV